MNQWQALLIGTRPPTLLLGISPVLLGSALGVSQILGQGDSIKPSNIVVFVLAIVSVVLMQSAANLVNDVKDAETGVDGEGRKGPLRMVQAGLLSRDFAVKAYRVMLGVSVLLGLGLSFYGGKTTIILAVICSLVAYLYTGGPKPLSHLGLGEIVALIFFGPVAVLGSAYLQSLTWQWQDLFWSLGPGFLAAAVMAINNLRDRRGDSKVGKLTLAVKLSDKWGQQLPWLLIMMSLIVFLSYSLWNNVWVGGLAISFIFLQLLRKFVQPLLFPKADLLNQALKKTSLFVAVYCLLYAIVVML